MSNSKKRTGLIVFSIIITSFLTGIIVGVYSNGPTPTINEITGISGFTWLNATTAVNAPEFYRNAANYTAWIESIVGEVTDHGALTGLTDDDHPQYQTKELISSGLADHAYSGTTITGTAGEALVIGNLVYIDSDGKYYMTDANSPTTMFCIGVSTETISQDSTGKILLEGYLRDDSWSGWTIGSESPLFVSGTAGSLTQTLPSTSGDQVQIVGYAIAPKIIRFDPDSTVVEIS